MTWDGYDRGIADSEANEWKEELRKQKLPDEAIWSSVVRRSEPESTINLSIKVFREAGGGGHVYVHRNGEKDYELLKFEELDMALMRAHILEAEVLSRVVKLEGK